MFSYVWSISPERRLVDYHVTGLPISACAARDRTQGPEQETGVTVSASTRQTANVTPAESLLEIEVLTPTASYLTRVDVSAVSTATCTADSQEPPRRRRRVTKGHGEASNFISP